MIRVQLAYLVVIYLLAMLAMVGVLWASYEWRRRRMERRFLRHRFRCATCNLEYEDKSTEVLTRCPRCASLNERVKLSRI